MPRRLTYPVLGLLLASSLSHADAATVGERDQHFVAIEALIERGRRADRRR